MMRLEKIREIAAEVLGREIGPQHDDTPLFGDEEAERSLGGDSLDRVDLAMTIEEEFGIEVREGDVACHFGSIASIDKYLATRLD